MAETPPDWFAFVIGLCIGIVLGLLIARLIDTWSAIKKHAADRDEPGEKPGEPKGK